MRPSPTFDQSHGTPRCPWDDVGTVAFCIVEGGILREC
ncbi:hypothetical protein DSOL_0152 [Desulfosporosinus metallidurans]|uniref:Uncharacterized protein n=1 Tax=Desulfosporosinus metallidurans TaxID=1888891 RepID=A0A1Q8R312_9FIRM|nr:hypothetical protein DSOL_0152 [Desulfosporosinus metallidurans]